MDTTGNTTTTTTANKDSRFEMRLSQEQRSRLDQAAELKGLSTSQWALSNLLEAAERDIREAHVIRLDERAWNDFTSALDAPMSDRMARLLHQEPIWR